MSRFPALDFADFRRYLAGNFLSNAGTHIQTTALAYHVYVLTGSSFMVGLLGICRVVPLLIFTLFAGVLADHADRRKVMLATQSGMAAVSLILATAEWTFGVTPALIYVLVALSSIAIAIDGPSRQSLVVSLVPARHFPNAVSIGAIGWRLAEVIGPVVAGFLMASKGLGFAACYLINSISFLAVLYAVWRMPPKPPENFDIADRPQNLKDVIGQINEGWRFVNSTPVIRHAMWIDFWATFFSAADALLPAMSEHLKLGPQGYGMLSSSAAIGAAIAAGILAVRKTFIKQGAWVVGMVAVYGFATVMFAVSLNPILAGVFLGMTGAADMISTVMRQTLRQLATPDSMRGRMTAISSLFFISGPRLGDFEAGLVSRAVGDRWSVAVGGIACMGIAALFTRAKSLVGYRHAVSGKDHEG